MLAKQPENSLKKIASLPDGEEDSLSTAIARKIAPLLPHGTRAQVVAQVLSVVQSEQFSGPIAHPKHLREYEEICPGAADRIIGMAESEVDHSQLMQTAMLNAEIADNKEGRRLGFAALVILMMGAIVCGALGKDTIALALLGATMVGVIGTIIKGRSSNGD